MKYRITENNQGQKIDANGNFQYFILCNKFRYNWRIFVIEANQHTAELFGHKVSISEIPKNLHMRM